MKASCCGDSTLQPSQYSSSVFIPICDKYTIFREDAYNGLLKVPLDHIQKPMLQESLSTDPLLPRSPSGGSLASPIPPPSLYTDHVLPLNPASLHSAASAARCATVATQSSLYKSSLSPHRVINSLLSFSSASFHIKEVS